MRQGWRAITRFRNGIPPMNHFAFKPAAWVSGACLLLTSSMALSQSMAKVDGGSVHFKGTVVNAGCAVDTNSIEQEVSMGQIRRDAFTGVGSWVDPVGFTITLTDCDISVSQSAGVAFQGPSDIHDPLVFAVANGPGSAVGVGLGIYDEQSNLIVPNSAPRAYKTLIDGTNVCTSSLNIARQSNSQSLATRVLPQISSCFINRAYAQVNRHATAASTFPLPLLTH